MSSPEKQKLALKTKLYVYISHFLSAWGDRMWSFGVGLFLIELAPESLQLVAIYGFSKGASVLLFGAIIGDWVDNTARLKAARLSLVLQNTLVVVCAIVVFLVVVYQQTLRTVWADEGALKLSHAIIIILAVLSDLSSMARHIAVERDWIVEICGRDKDMLASMSARLRAIDLSTAILAPVATGQIIYFIALQFGAVFIAGWNLVSVFVEYFLIWKVYEEVPALKKKKFKKRKDKEITDEGENIDLEDKHPLNQEDPQSGEVTEEATSTHQTKEAQKGDDSEKEKCHPVLYNMFKSFIVLFRGWNIYMKYDVAFAGLGLAALYMTVMGFDNITVGFAYSQGISESTLGILMAAGSLCGIAGTFAYPRFRKKIGLERTGLFGFAFEVFCLCFCVASVFAPGSPFDLLHRLNGDSRKNSGLDEVEIVPNFNVRQNHTVSYDVKSFTGYNLTDNTTVLPTNSTSDKQLSYISIGLYLGGLITARFGLWVADLTITQLFLQSVTETERGIVSGIQRSLNQLMDMLKFLMVILAPYPEEYGLLVFISFGFVCTGWALYAKYSRSARGHLFHFDKICSDRRNNNITTNMGNRNGGESPEGGHHVDETTDGNTGVS